MTCKIIAEIGWNHMGDMNLAKEMVAAAAEAGADYAKFQTWAVENLRSGPWDTDGRIDIYRKAGLTREQHHELAEYCISNKIQFLTSIFNIHDADWLSEVSSVAIKVPSHEVYNTALMGKVDGAFERIFVSTGAANWGEVKAIPNMFKKSRLTLFHCVSAYPCPAENVNLPRINELKKLTSSVGYSGHYFGIDDALASLHYGVEYIEKHFTLDRSLPGRDNQFSVLPDQLTFLCRYKDNLCKMNESRGVGHQSCEQDIIEHYRGRWSK